MYACYNSNPSDGRFVASNNLALCAEAFRSLGGFDERFRFAGDRDLCDRWRHSGRRLLYVPEAVVLHGHELTLIGFCRQHFGYGKGAFRFHRARAQRGSGSLVGELSFYLGLPRSASSAVVRSERRGATAALLLLWQATNALGNERTRLHAGSSGGPS